MRVSINMGHMNYIFKSKIRLFVIYLPKQKWLHHISHDVSNPCGVLFSSKFQRVQRQPYHQAARFKQQKQRNTWQVSEMCVCQKIVLNLNAKSKACISRIDLAIKCKIFNTKSERERKKWQSTDVPLSLFSFPFVTHIFY